LQGLREARKETYLAAGGKGVFLGRNKGKKSPWAIRGKWSWGGGPNEKASWEQGGSGKLEETCRYQGEGAFMGGASHA